MQFIKELMLLPMACHAHRAWAMSGPPCLIWACMCHFHHPARSRAHPSTRKSNTRPYRNQRLPPFKTGLYVKYACGIWGLVHGVQPLKAFLAIACFAQCGTASNSVRPCLLASRQGMLNCREWGAAHTHHTPPHSYDNQSRTSCCPVVFLLVLTRYSCTTHCTLAR